MKRKIIIAVVVMSILLLIMSATIFMTNSHAASNVRQNLKLANQYIDSGAYEEAILTFDKVLNIDENNTPARVGLSKAYREIGNYPQAASVLREGLDKQRNDKNLWHELVDVYLWAYKETHVDLSEVSAVILEAYKRTGDKKYKQWLEENSERGALDVRDYKTGKTQADKKDDLLAVQRAALDLCFVVDTTGSMGDDIENAKQNMTSILQAVTDKYEDYRIALIDYRDFPEHSYYEIDYACKLRLDFTDDIERVKNAINALDLGDGGDNKEAVYSGIIMASKLDWAENSVKNIIVIGDAPPHDPEPVTGYTLDDVLKELYKGGIKINLDDENYQAIFEGALNTYVSVNTIGTSASDDAIVFFENIADITGGSYKEVEKAEEVSDAIIESIEEMKVITLQNTKVYFDDRFKNTEIELYKDGEYQFTTRLDDKAIAKFEDVEIGDYTWFSPNYDADGIIKINDGDKKTTPQIFKEPTIKIYKEKSLVTMGLILAIVFAVGLLYFMVVKLAKLRRKKEE